MHLYAAVASVPSTVVDTCALSTYIDNMTDKQWLATDAAGEDPDVGLRAVHALRVLVERLEELQVDSARRQGWSWQDIAERLGVSRQAVHKKHAAGHGLLRREK
jgi:DNA-binding NarL/FixJ family response regulator